MLLTNLREVLQCPEKAPRPSCCLQVLSQSQLRHYAIWAFKHKNWDADAMIIKDGRFGWQRFIKPKTSQWFVEALLENELRWCFDYK